MVLAISWYASLSQVLISYPKGYQLVGYGSSPDGTFVDALVSPGVHMLEFKRGNISYFALVEVPRGYTVYLYLEESDLVRPIKALPEGQY